MRRLLMSEQVANNGQPIQINALAAPGDNLHTSAAGATDQVRLVVSNTNAAVRILSLIVAGAAAGEILEHTVAADSIEELPPILVADGAAIAAFGPAGGDLRVTGEVLRT